MAVAEADEPEAIAFASMVTVPALVIELAASPTPLLLQSGKLDALVSIADAETVQAAALEPKTIRWYQAGHGLDLQAAYDRHDWLQDQIGLDARQ